MCNLSITDYISNHFEISMILSDCKSLKKQFFILHDSTSDKKLKKECLRRISIIESIEQKFYNDF